MRPAALAFFFTLAVYFLSRRARARSAAAARSRFSRHLDSGVQAGHGNRAARRMLALLELGASALARRRGAVTVEKQSEALASDLTLYLRCGIPLDEAVAVCAQGLGPPLSEPLRRYRTEVSLGADPAAALLELVRPLGSGDLELIALAAVTSRETGSDIRRVMDGVGEAVRDRAAMRRELEAQTVQGRISGRIVAGLPLVFLALSALVSRGTVAALLGTAPGILMLLGGTALNALGFVWIRRILHIKV